MQVLHYLGMEIQHIEERYFKGTCSRFREASPLHYDGKRKTNNCEEGEDWIEYATKEVTESSEVFLPPMSPYINCEERRSDREESYNDPRNIGN